MCRACTPWFLHSYALSYTHAPIYPLTRSHAHTFTHAYIFILFSTHTHSPLTHTHTCTHPSKEALTSETPWLAPEHFKHPDKHMNKSSDVYSYGILLFEVRVSVCVYICMWESVYVCERVYVCVWVFVYSISTWTRARMCIRTEFFCSRYVCVFVCVCVEVNIYITCIHTLTNAHSYSHTGAHSPRSISWPHRCQRTRKCEWNEGNFKGKTVWCMWSVCVCVVYVECVCVWCVYVVYVCEVYVWYVCICV
jgi:hypothetical protein